MKISKLFGHNHRSTGIVPILGTMLADAAVEAVVAAEIVEGGAWIGLAFVYFARKRVIGGRTIRKHRNMTARKRRNRLTQQGSSRVFLWSKLSRANRRFVW